MNLKSIAAAALLLAAAITPASAMTQTFTDVAQANFAYEAESGISSIDWSITYGPGNNEPYYACCVGPVMVGDIAGDYFITGNVNPWGDIITQVGFPMGNHTPGLNVVCDRRQTCTTTGTFSHFFESGMLSFYLWAGGDYGRELLTSSITFTGPDPIPLPAALPLFGAALAGLGFLRWRGRKA